MKPPGTKFKNTSALQKDSAVSALIGVILIISLTLVMTAVFSVLFFSFLGNAPTQKSAYIVAEAKYNTQYGYPMISLLNRAGDTGVLSGSGSGYPLTIQISAGGEIITANPDTEDLKWTPGTSLFIILTDVGYTITDSINRINETSLAFPVSEITVTVIDSANNVIIFSQKVKTENLGNFTTTATPTSTATSEILTAAAAVSTHKLIVTWSPATYGYASLSPPEPIENSKQIILPTGSSRTVYFVPDAKRTVMTIKLDGVIVYSGSSMGSTIEYTISNVTEDHTLRASFG